MDELYVVSKRKYKVMRVMSVVLPILAILVTVFFGALYHALTRDYIPNDGIWYCEESGLEINFNIDKRTATTADGEVLSIYGHHNRVSIDRILSDTTDAEINEETEVPHEEMVHRFTVIKYKKDRWVVKDIDGNEYVFVRKQVSQYG